MIVLAVYNAIALPMQIAFTVVQEYYDSHVAAEVVEYSVDIFFVADMVVMFFTSYIDVTDGETIRSPKVISKSYLAGGFPIDFISSTPILLRQIVNQTTVKGSDLNS